MATENINWTAQQKLALDSAGRDILVTASAGTGKTAVLAERCANLLADTSNPTDVSQILVLTFTNAAAGEMQARIAQNLLARFQQNRSSYLRRQLLTLDAAHISTIHTFCKRIITDNFHLLDIDPTFRIIEDDEKNLLESEVLTAVIDLAWRDESILPGLSELLRGRSIQSLTSDFLEKIIVCSRFLDSVVGRASWYERALALTDAAVFSTSRLVQQQKKTILEKLVQCKSQLEYSKLLDRQKTHGHWADQIDADFLNPIDKCIEYLQKDDLDRCAGIIHGFSKPNFKRRPKNISAETADLIKEPAQEAIKTLQNLSDLATINPEYEEVVASSASLQTKVMVELIKRFDRQYAETKTKLNCLDFADLEHQMLRLLTESDSTCTALRKRFRYIFVDEYQDINPVQQGILDKISRPDNVFVVGDIKQSIYAFRKAQPQIFLNRLQRAAENGPPQTGPVRVDLSGNFRSRKGILDFANTVFSRTMTAPAFLIDYDEKMFLEPRFSYEPLEQIATQKEPLVEICILDEEPGGQSDGDFDENSTFASTDIINPTQRQAAFIAGRIERMAGSKNAHPKFKIYDKKTGEYRPVEYRDIVILMRSPAHRANQYVEVFELAGIPVSSQSRSGYFAANEITDCISLLKVLDNPQQDIEFAAVLRSAFFKVTDTELTMLRGHGASTEVRLSFYDCARSYSHNGPDKRLRQKIDTILKQIDLWRRQARSRSLAELLWQILRQTGYLSFVRALPNGPQRRANILKLHERAIQFENFITGPHSTSLTRFVEFIEKLLELDQDWAPAEPDNLTENAVRIMSIHKSKGLEFPVVFLAELNSPFNKKDGYGDCLIDDDLGIGLQIIRPESNLKLSTIAHEVIAQKKLDTMLAEEMRILYVAITRARERLILTVSSKKSDCTKILAACGALPDEPVRDWQLKSAKCHFDWLTYALADRKELRDLFEPQPCPKTVEGNLFTARLLEHSELEDISNKVLQQKQTRLRPSPAESVEINDNAEQLFDKVKKSLTWKYPLDDLTKLPAKTSVSKLTHPEDEFAQADLTSVLQKEPGTVSADRPGAVVLGTATHLVIQNLPLDRDITIESIRETADRLAGRDKIQRRLIDKIDFDSILKFFRSDLGSLVTKHRNDILREWPFTFAYNGPELGRHADSEFVIIQGIIDMLIKTPAGLVVIDFKTDDVNAPLAREHARQRKYDDQMRYYTAAASAILKQKIASAWLYFLKPNIPVKAEA